MTWPRQTIRHKNAAKFGKAGGPYAVKKGSIGRCCRNCYDGENAYPDSCSCMCHEGAKSAGGTPFESRKAKIIDDFTKHTIRGMSRVNLQEMVEKPWTVDNPELVKFASMELALRFGAQPTIDTIGGKAYFYKLEVENEQGRWNDSYQTNAGYWVIHKGEKHYVYRVIK